MTELSRTSSRSGRSYPNVRKLSLAPLSPRYPIDGSTPPPPGEHAVHTPRSSYIASRTAPTTPGILNLRQTRSNSRTRRPQPPYAYDGYFVNHNNPDRDVGEIPKARSTSTLQPGVSFTDENGAERQHRRKSTAPVGLRIPLVRHHTADSEDEWWHRAGLAIAEEARDSKGQGWLVRRESATSLVAPDDMDERASEPMVLLSGEQLDAFEFPSLSPRMSRAGSRYQSRVGSIAPSARDSRRNSRVDFGMSSLSPRQSRRSSRIDLGMSPLSPRISLDLPSLDERFAEPHFIEPDFVEAGEDGPGDEEEVARLAQQNSSWIDKLIGWTLFPVDEDGEASSEDEDQVENFLPQNMTKEELRLRREVEAKRRKLEREAIVAAAKLKAGGDKENTEQGEARRPSSTDLRMQPEEEGGAWQDATWLMGVASKALF